ncbi:DUF222 domain-containing protein [Williamsia sp. M5A3_1d]
MFAGVDVTGVDDLLASPSAHVAIAIARDAQRSENRCAAAKVIAAGRLHAIRFAAISAGEDGLGPQFGNIADKGATVEVATTLGVSTSKATTLIGLSILLEGLPDLRAAFLHGDMDLYRVNMIATTIGTHEPLVRKQLEAEAVRLDADTAMSHRQLRDRLEEMSIDLDPEQAAHDREAFAEQQDFRVKPDRHGHSAITGCVPAQNGVEIDGRIAALVATLCPADPRSIGQKRVAALLAMARAENTLSCWCGSDHCPSASADRSAEVEPTRTMVVLHTDLDTIMASEIPGGPAMMTPWIEGHGAIDPALARALSTEASWETLADDVLTDRNQSSASGARRGRRRPRGRSAACGRVTARHRVTPRLRDRPAVPSPTRRHSRCASGSRTTISTAGSRTATNRPAPARSITRSRSTTRTRPAVGGRSGSISRCCACSITT